MIKIGDVVEKIYGENKCPFCGCGPRFWQGYPCGYEETWYDTSLNQVIIEKMCKNYKEEQEQQKEIISTGTLSSKTCSCDFNELMNYGCKCGGI